MAWESDVDALAWFESALGSDVAAVRRAALDLLGRVECASRAEWLHAAARDPDATVSATAALTEAQIAGREPRIDDLHESEFAQGREESDLSWEWEYGFKVVRGTHVPAGLTVVWVKEEDDAMARQLALMKALAGAGTDDREATPVLVRKRYVNQYTRSPRTLNEALRWQSQGRPPYGEP